MTTIIATKTALGADTMVVVVGQAPYPAKKIDRTKTKLFGAAGDGGDCVRFIQWAKMDFDPDRKPKFRCKPGHPDEATLLVVSNDGIFLMLSSDLFPEPVESNFYAIGSGSGAALGAMEKGASIEEALEIAAKYDSNTRGPFNILYLKENAS